MKTALDVLRAGARWLEERGADSPRYTMQCLLCHVLGCDRTRLYLEGDRPLAERELARLRELLARRGRGEPLQHLTGGTEFYRRPFKTDGRALVPRPETEELAELALRLMPRRRGMRVLDMGAGSGVLGITLALELAEFLPEVVLADISAEALGLALENAASLGARVNTVRSDLFSAWAGGSPLSLPDMFDVVLANLPYIPEGEELPPEVRCDPAAALYGGPLGTEIVGRFLREALPRLAPGAFVALEVGHDQGSRVLETMAALGYERLRLEKDLGGVPRFPLACAPSAPRMR
ncbi:MAG: peptide chain release factor N(5)-glutamine methyltransferase [Akkermansiaceae bacterium]|nr:peptide chain release factor N(5)-glutamine methyltransferase [Akkermansiaceae bacterium]